MSNLPTFCDYTGLSSGDDSYPTNKAECLFEYGSIPSFLWSLADRESATLSLLELLRITRCESEGCLSGETFYEFSNSLKEEINLALYLCLSSGV